MVFKIFLIIFCLLLPFIVYGSVVINEIAWMGTETNSSDEWIELYNTTNEDINLDGWVLKADDGAPKINLEEKIPAKGFYLLERTDDDTIPGISADQIYAGALSNNGETLLLYNQSGGLADSADYSSGWPAGDNATKQTMEKIGSNWQTSAEAGGTPRENNSELKIKNYEEKQEKAEKKPEVGPRVNYPGGIVFNEILPSPEGPDAENEWIEIYNQNDFEIDLSGWEIRDQIGASKTYTINNEIPAWGYLVFRRTETKITINNDKDGLEILNPNGEIIDSAAFEKSPQNQSYARTGSGWVWTKTLTPGSKNIVSAAMEKINKIESAENSKGELSRDKPYINSQEIALTNETANSSKPRLFLIASAVSLFSGIAFLIVKNNLKNIWY